MKYVYGESWLWMLNKCQCTNMPKGSYIQNEKNKQF